MNMNEDIKDAFVAAALETCKKLSDCPEIKNYRVYSEPRKNLKNKIYQRAALARKSTPTVRAVSYEPFRWVLIVSAQNSARRASFKIRGYRQADY